MSETASAPPAQEQDAQGSSRRGRRGRKDATAAAAAAPGPQETRARLAGGSNRTEITLTSFDFLGGAYAMTTRARRIALGVLGVLGLILAYLLVSVVSTMASASSVESEAEQWKQRENEVIASFGQAAGINVDQRLAIDRRQELEKSLITIAAGQFDLESILGQLNSVVVPGAQAVTLRAGFLASTADDVTTLDPAKGAPMELVGSSDGYLQGVEWAAGIAALPGLYDPQAFPDGSEAVTVTAFLPLGTPPAVLVQRLADLGIVYVAPKDPVQVTAPESAKKAASQSAAPEAAPAASPGGESP